MKTFVEAHHTPPGHLKEPPFVRVNPDRLAPSVRDTQGSPPVITVNYGPLPLRNVRALVTLTQPGNTPLVTKTTSFVAAVFTASWMFVAAVAQLV